MKINISKAYNRVDWNYLRLVMFRKGFHHRWMDIIMLCVSSVRYSITVNGAEFGPIVPKRGLR